MKILIIYGTTEGQTRKIAHFIEDQLQNLGHPATVYDTNSEPPSPDFFDAVLIGASIHIHKYQTGVLHYVKEHKEQLNKMPSAFFSVCMAAASDIEEEHQEMRQIAEDFLKDTGWQPIMTEHFAGALKYTKYDFFKKFMMRQIAKKEGGSVDTSQDHEYTDWQQVKKFSQAFAGKADSQ